MSEKITIESKEKTTGKKVAKLAAFAGGTALLLSGCSTEAEPDYGTPNPEITSVTIKDGANLRESPHVIDEDGRTNFLHQVNLDDIQTETPIPTPNGAYIYPDGPNGDWIGISASDLPEDFDDKYKDSDGIIWVNEQMATENVASD